MNSRKRTLSTSSTRVTSSLRFIRSHTSNVDTQPTCESSITNLIMPRNAASIDCCLTPPIDISICDRWILILCSCSTAQTHQQKTPASLVYGGIRQSFRAYTSWSSDHIESHDETTHTHTASQLPMLEPIHFAVVVIHSTSINVSTVRTPACDKDTLTTICTRT